MAENLIIVGGERLNYDGIFDVKEIVGVMKQWASDKGYWFVEISHSETTKPEGRYIEMDLMPFRKFTDYAKSVIRLKVQFSDLKDIVVERDGRKVKLQEGKIMFIFNGILETDYEHRWETKPLFYVLRIMFEKYLYTPYISGFEAAIKEDVTLLKDNLKAFLNLAQFSLPKI